MSREDFYKTEGRVIDHSRQNFTVEIDNGASVLCNLSGKMRKNNIHVAVGDRVQVEISPYDISKGYIVFRIG